MSSRPVHPCGVIALAAAALVCGGRPAAQEQPVFRSGVDLVTVDVSVVGAGGRPVDDLTAEKFRVAVDGIPRRVVSAVFVPYASSARGGSARDADFSSNEHVEPGRLLLIAVDQQHIRRVEGLTALRAASNFIDTLDPADRVAAAPLDHLGPIEFTNRHASVKRYVQTLAGTGTSMRGQFNIGLIESLAIADGQRTWLDRAVLRECGQPLARYENLARIAELEGFRDPCPVQVEQESRAAAQEVRARARTSLNQLLGLIARLAEIDGPKTMVLVSEGLVAEPQVIDLTSLGAAAQAARVTIYVLQLEQPLFDASDTIASPTQIQDGQVREDGLARLAGTARGAHFRLVGADPYPFQRILRELSGYYLVAFEASPADRDGRTRRIEVSTTEPGTIVRARPAFRRPADVPSGANEAQVVRLLRNPRLATELPLRISAHIFREAAANRVRVVVGAEADGGPADVVTFGYVLLDEAGVIAASGRDPASNGRFSQAFDVLPGRYALKVAAIDSTGRSGSVERRFDARLLRGTMVTSDLALTDAAPDEPLRPVVARVRSDRVGAVIEVYGASGSRTGEPTVRVDVARRNGAAPLLTAPAGLTPIGAASWRARAELDLRDLPPGDYLVTATVTLADGKVQKVERGFVR